MRDCQVHDADKLSLGFQRLGPLPIINHFLSRIGLEGILARHVPTTDTRTRLRNEVAIGVLLRSIMIEREPIYRQLP